VDNPPAVTAVNPADAATNVPVDTNVEITFSEGVTVTGTWFTISCTTSSDVTPANSAVTGGPVTYTIDPNTDFDGSDACTLTVFAAQVADTDGTPDNPTADFTSTFNTPAPPATLTIAEIQGAGNDSPQAGNTVTTSGNVVTAVVSNGFYMQSQPGNEDADPLTSEGIFVFTDGAPSVVEANVVTVTGTIEEFFSSTQFDDAGLSVQVTASEGILPAPIDLNTNTPSTTASVVPWFERYEGMLVTVANALVNAPTDRFGDTFLTVESTLRLREEGIEFPGQASLPVWDGNPELFEIDPNGVDQADVSFNVGGTVSATGPLSFQFGDYGIEAKSYTVGSTGDSVQAVRDAVSGEVTIGSLNLFRLFASENDYQTRLAKFSLYIRTILKSPAILGVQECNSITELTALATRISTDGGPTYTPFLVEGNDVGGIDVGYLVDETQVANVSITQLGATETFTNPNNGQPSTTHDRPPLLLEGEFSASNPNTPISVLNIHSRSLGSIDDPTDGNRVRVKRHEQAKSIGNMMKARETDNLVVIGDYNAFEFSDGFVDVLEQMSGNVGDANDSLIPYDAANAPTVPFTNQVVQQLPASERYSFFFSGNGQVLDHIL
ncbi:MAG: Ig-like domain-containing protein, partial [Bacteroidota bacterium]